MSELLTRTITGFIFGTVLLGSILLNVCIESIVFGLFVLLGLWEFHGLFKSHADYSTPQILSTTLGIFFFVFIAIYLQDGIHLFYLKILLSITFIVLLSELFRKNNQPLIVLSLTIFPLLYFVVPFLLMLQISILEYSSFPLLIGMFIIIWTNDSMAYFIGKAYGKKPLFKRVSPNKSWEGTIAGFIFSFPAAYILFLTTESMDMTFWLVSALIISPCAVLGDLLESLFKRSLNIKDTGNILPGHGGILDRFDAVVFTVPFFYLWIEFYDLFIK